MAGLRAALFEGIPLSTSSAPVQSRLPAFLYGCAWKKERTDTLVRRALNAGFCGIDVAAQPRHYREDRAGAGLRQALSDGSVKRGDLFVQTKYSPPPAQDPHAMPYDAQAGLSEQVQQSVRQSLHNLRTEDGPAAEAAYIDSLLLHSPLRTVDETMQAWEACETFVPDSVKFLGLSNVTLPVLQEIHRAARVKPTFVQNRFYPDTSYDQDLRRWCRANGIIYQAFWTLTANPRLVNSPPVHFMCKAVGVEPAVALYCFVLALDGNISIMNGTTSHMEEDLEGLKTVRAWAERDENQYEWENQLKHFKDLIGENRTGNPGFDETYKTGRRKPIRGDLSTATTP